MTRTENGRKVFVYAAPQERAEAIETVAGPNKDIEASSAPMKRPVEAEFAARRTFREIETTGACGYNQDLDRIVDRYKRLGERGTASMVEVSVPEEANFDFMAFHQEVDELLGPDKSQVKVL